MGRPASAESPAMQPCRSVPSIARPFWAPGGGIHKAGPGDGEASPIMPPSPMAAARGLAHGPEAKKPELDAAA